jgi:hypothetical protein
MKIYKITNTINNKVYIGQTTTSGNVRWMAHRLNLKKGIHPNKHLQSSWNRYGESSFIYEVITKGCEGLLDILEISYIEKYKSDNNQYGYNKDHGGHLNRKRRVVSKDTIKKISIANTGKKRSHSKETRIKISNAKKGVPNKYKGIPNGKKGIPTGHVPTEQARLNMSLAQIGKKRKPINEENRKNISEAAKIGWIKRKSNKEKSNV